LGRCCVLFPTLTRPRPSASPTGTAYGLSGAVFSTDQEKAKAVGGKLQTGQVFVNGGAFNPLAPFGGFGHSGVGREFGKWGLEEFFGSPRTAAVIPEEGVKPDRAELEPYVIRKGLLENQSCQ
jgi:NAD-dependent aldehyde dehydrogenases